MLHVIDYLEASDHGLEWYAKVHQGQAVHLGRALFAPRYRGQGLLE